MKKLLRFSSVRNFILLFNCLLTFLTSTYSSAQTFVPPSASNSFVDIYPTSPSNAQWMARSCYEYSNAIINGNHYDLFISAWRDQSNVAHIVWRAMDLTIPALMPSVDTQFVIDSTTNIQNISVGIIRTTSGYQALVAYNDYGTTPTCGVVLKVFDVLTTGPEINSVNVSTTVLYAQNNYATRVCMDSWDAFSAVVWDEYHHYPLSVDRDIKCLVIKDGIFNSPVLLNGTTQNTNADVAIATSKSMLLHFVYFNPSSDEITESTAGFSDVWNAAISGFVVYPNVEDVNSVTTTQDPRPTLDCPANFTHNNWAYAYFESPSNNDMLVRLFDGSGTATPTTVNLTDGSLIPTALTGWNNSWPTLTYGPTAQDIYIAWQTSSSGVNKSICVEISIDGGTLLSAADYLQIPFATTYWPNGLLMCKNNEASTLYVIHSYNDNMGVNQISHQFHTWNSPESAFKGEAKNLSTSYNIAAWPTPFTNSITLDVSSGLMNEKVKVCMTDILGRVVFSKEIQGRNLNDMVNNYLTKMNTGTYMLSISKSAFKYSQVIPLVKTNNN